MKVMRIFLAALLAFVVGSFAVIFIAIVVSETKLDFLKKKKRMPQYRARMNDE